MLMALAVASAFVGQITSAAGLAEPGHTQGEVRGPCGALSLEPAGLVEVGPLSSGVQHCFDLPQLPHNSITAGVFITAYAPGLQIRVASKETASGFRGASLMIPTGSVVIAELPLPTEQAVILLSTWEEPSEVTGMTLGLIEIGGVLHLNIVASRIGAVP